MNMENNRILLNCDLGEWEAPEITAQLISKVDLANIACGGHAGTEESIRNCIKLCKDYDTLPGLHPGIPGQKGREERQLKTETFKLLLEDQYQTFIKFCSRPNHIKLHGALYHLSEADPAIRNAYLQFVEKKSLNCICLAEGKVAKALGERALHEAFLDRNYLANGSLVPRSEKNALVSSVSDIERRLGTNTIQSVDGRKLTPKIDTFCIHSDSAVTQTWFSSSH